MLKRDLGAPPLHFWGPAATGINSAILPLFLVSRPSACPFFTPSLIPAKSPVPESHSP
jgi:hypothetical protein